MIRSNGERGISFYSRIHEIGPEELNQILSHCKLAKWGIHPEDYFLLSRWAIQFCASGTLLSIDDEKFLNCARLAMERSPVLWNEMTALLENLKTVDGYGERIEDNFRQVALTIHVCKNNFEDKVEAFSSLLSMIQKGIPL